MRILTILTTIQIICSLVSCEVFDYPWECRPVPKCALVLFIHVEKTGGTTLRQLFVGQKRWGEAWRTLGYRGGQRAIREFNQILTAAENNLEKFLQDYGPRHFFEVHGMQADFLPSIRRLKALAQNDSSEFVKSGCIGLTTSNFREPKKFYLSNLRETFGHSIYLRRFKEKIATNYAHLRFPRAIYYEMDWRREHPLEKWYEELINLEVRSLVARYLSNVQQGGREIFQQMDRHHISEELYQKAVDFLNELDFVGITERYSETMLGLQNLVGVKHIHGMRAYSNTKAKEFSLKNNLTAQENKYMELVANMSNMDQALFKQAQQKFEQQLIQIPNFNKRFAALKQQEQLKKYTSIQDGAQRIC